VNLKSEERPRKDDELMSFSWRVFRGRTLQTLAAAVAVSSMGVAAFILPLSSVVSAAPKVAFATSRATSNPGLHIYEVDGRRYGLFTAIHVLAFSGSQYTVQIGLAHHAVDGGTQTTSTICRSTAGCVAAVNGDLFDLTNPGKPDPGDEVGGIIQDCVLLHTPEIVHPQADLDGPSLSKGLTWSSTVDVNGESVPITAINQELPMSYVGVHLPLTGTLLFTSPYGLQTPTATGWVTYEFTPVDATTSPTTIPTPSPTPSPTTSPTASPTTSPTTINSTTELTFVAQTTKAVSLAPGTVDISASTGSPLATLQAGDTVSLTTTSTAGCDNIGGHSILLNAGVIEPIAPADAYLLEPYARTVIGWTASGGTVILTVDGKDGVSGATGYQLDYFLQSLNVVTALDLDGGNSTTFFADGRVLNKPSQGGQRPVSTSLLIVRKP
jgi:hypothetical protein